MFFICLSLHRPLLVSVMTSSAFVLLLLPLSLFLASSWLCFPLYDSIRRVVLPNCHVLCICFLCLFSISHFVSLVLCQACASYVWFFIVTRIPCSVCFLLSLLSLCSFILAMNPVFCFPSLPSCVFRSAVIHCCIVFYVHTMSPSFYASSPGFHV